MSVRLKIVGSAGFLMLLLAGTLSLEGTRPDSYPQGPGDEVLRPDGRTGESLRTLVQSTRAKNRIAELVAQRRLGLLEGAAALRAVDASWPAQMRVPIARQYSDCTEEEAYCRAMIAWAGPVLRARQADPSLLEELQAELSRRLNGPEPLRLPEVDLEQYLPPDLLPHPCGTDECGRPSSPLAPRRGERGQG